MEGNAMYRVSWLLFGMYQVQVSTGAQIAMKYATTAFPK
jgi:hypothetical protein